MQMKATIIPEYLSIKQLSAYCGFAERSVREFIKHQTNPLPHYRISRKGIRIRRSDFDGWFLRYRIDHDTLTEQIAIDVINGTK